MRVAYSDHSSNSVSGFGSAKPVLHGTNTTEPNLLTSWINHIQGWMTDLNMLLSCFREKMSELTHLTFNLGNFILWHAPSTPKRSSSWVHLGLILDTGSTLGSSLVSSEEAPIVAPVGEGGEGTVYGSSLLSFARLSNAERYCLLFCTLRLYETISLKLNKTCHLHARTHHTVLEVRAIV